MARRDPDMKYLVTVETEGTGLLYFGPFKSEEAAQAEAARFERAGIEDWGVEELQPRSYAPEWRRIMREHAAST